MPTGMMKDPDRTSTMSTASYGRTLPTTPKKNTDANIKKVAVTMPERDTAGGQLIEFDQKRPLESIIQEICERWNLQDPSTYALRFNEPDQKLYITEKNRKDIRDGQVLNLTPSAAQTAERIKSALSGSRLEDKNAALRQLSFLASDITFAEEFVKIRGHQIVIDILTTGNFKGDSLAYTLKSFVCLMEHSILSWDILEPEFIKRVADCVNVSAHHLDTSCLQSALDILESVVLHCTNRQSVVEQVVTPVNVIPHLESSSPEVQKNAIALINALFTRADEMKRKKIAESLQSKSMRNVILSNVIRGQIVGAGMAHELYVLQMLLLNLNEDRMRMGVDPHDQMVLREIEELRRIAFDVDPNINSVRKSQNAAEDYKKLGFEKAESPVEDFAAVPPGLLALDVMLYFARNHWENYVKVVLENSTRVDEHVCPFVQASKRLTQILCEVLHIGDQPSENGDTYYVMFFSHDKPFEEFFSISIQLLNKTWREMKATTQDFAKVLEVVREQITRSLDLLPSSFETFRSKVNSLTYNEISKIRENERREKEGQGAQLKPIIELREQIAPEIRELVQQQRLNYLMAGTRFAKYTKDGKCKDKFWYWMLSHNCKALHYGDCREQDTPTLEQLTNKLPLADIQKLVTGRECPHVNVRDRGRRVTAFKVAFCLKPELEKDPFCFMASSENEFDLWTDGLNYLLGNEMVSSQVKKDEEILLSMEIKMRMLDTEGVAIPAEAPAIPPPPINYNFAYLNL
ncbi:engulfment and cell motility protein 1 isoform X2 [Aplysia californica]|uniref:Engulfment and cell motility protein 1 isoform X2 n=1 Tax=Aplysia californica TaxID=6500 RepID=A0ABM0JL69_APLCA|nr:engulfment and cell motility protein 1 isoform X2 [Aplysia californica]